MVGEGELDDESIDARVVVEPMDNLQQFVLCDVRRALDEGALESDPGTTAHLVVHISAAGAILAHENGGEVGLAVSGRHVAGDILSDFGFDPFGQVLAVQNLRGVHFHRVHRGIRIPPGMAPRPIMPPSPRRLPPPLIIFIIFFISPNCLMS